MHPPVKIVNGRKTCSTCKSLTLLTVYWLQYCLLEKYPLSIKALEESLRIWPEAGCCVDLLVISFHTQSVGIRDLVMVSLKNCIFCCICMYYTFGFRMINKEWWKKVTLKFYYGTFVFLKIKTKKNQTQVLRNHYCRLC